MNAVWRRVRALGGCIAVLAAAAATGAVAAEPNSACAAPGGVVEGFHFQHHDWEVACDNTRTCRAAGYHEDGDALAVSLLLTRAAGPGTPVEGQAMIGEYEEHPQRQALPSPLAVTVRIDGRSVGKLLFKGEPRVAMVPAALVKALLPALRRRSTIAFSHGALRWRLSGRGAAATLLKMDDFQGRVGTTGALSRPGSRPDSRACPPLAAAPVEAAPLAPPHPEDPSFANRYQAALLPALRASTHSDDCPLLFEGAAGVDVPQVRRLSDRALLVALPCWRAAYNEGWGYWVVQDRPPLQPRLVTTLGSGDEGQRIHASHKGRGLGDCWATDEWTWNGARFVHTASATTGLCRLMAPGGAWNLPTRVSRALAPR